MSKEALRIAQRIVELAHKIKRGTAQLSGPVLFTESYDLGRVIDIVRENDSAKAAFRAAEPLTWKPTLEQSIAFNLALGQEALKLEDVCAANKKVLPHLLAYTWQRMKENFDDSHGIDIVRATIDYADFHEIRERLDLKPYSHKLFAHLDVTESDYRAYDTPHALIAITENFKISAELTDRLEAMDNSEAEFSSSLNLSVAYLDAKSQMNENFEVLAELAAQQTEYQRILEQSKLTPEMVRACLTAMDHDVQTPSYGAPTRTLN